MKTRVFKVPRDFVNFEDPLEPGPVPLPEDPFAAPATPDLSAVSARKKNEPVRLIKTARNRLEEVGLVFPEGASASYDPYASTITLTNTQGNLDLFEACLEMGCNIRPAHVSFLLTVIEGPGEIIREANAAAAGQEDASIALSSLLKRAAKTNSGVRVVQSAYLESRSGMRVTTRSVKEHYHPVVSSDEDNQLSTGQEMQMVGINMEIEPVIGPEGKHINFGYTLDLNPSPPTARQMAVSDPATGNVAEIPLESVPRVHFSADVQMLGGSTRLLGIASPCGNATGEGAEVMWAAFVTAHIVRVDNLPRARPQVKAAPLKVPAGMRKHTLPVPPGLLENVRHHSGLPLQEYLDANGLAPAAGAEAVLEGNSLTVVNTHENVERIVLLLEHLTAKQPKTVVLTLHTVQGSGDFLRSIATEAVSQQDHARQWAHVQEALSAGKHALKHVSTSRLETRPEVRASLEAVQEHACLTECRKDEKGRVGPQFETRRVGSVVEFEPTITWDGGIDLSLSHEFHPLPPQAARGQMVDPRTQQKHDFPIEDLHVLQTVTHRHVESGVTQLHSLLPPPGAGTGDHLFATFLQCEVVTHGTCLKESGPTLAEMMASVPKSDDQELFTKSFRVAPDFLMDDRDEPGGAFVGGGRKTAKEILEEAGISFPEGAMVHSGGATGQLVVRNTGENLDKVERFVTWIARETRSSSVAITSQVLQAPGPMVRRLMLGMDARSDHRAELDEMLDAVRQGKAKHLGLSRIETKIGSHGKAEQGVQQPFITGALASDVRLVGFSTEADVGMTGLRSPPRFPFTAEFHTAAPLEHREHVIDLHGKRLEFPLTDFYVMKLKTETVIPDGHARLEAVWKPMGRGEGEADADVLQVLFITCDEVHTHK